MLEQRCSRLTAKGRPCRSTLITWYDIEAPRPLTCWMHATEAERTASKAGAERSAMVWLTPASRILDGEPACWTWPVPAMCGALVIEALMADRANDAEPLARKALALWQAERCAICGEGVGLVTDHDHSTGLVRGELCRPCNTNEGIRKGGDNNVYARYRQRPPVRILGVRIRYQHPITGEYAEPLAPVDGWRDNPMRGIGL